MNGMIWTLLGTLLTFSVTTLGAAGVFFVKKDMGGRIQSGFLGFAGGVMIAASVWSLLLPGIEFAEENGQISWLVMTGGFLLGVLLLLAVDYLIGRWENFGVKKNTAMLVTAITAHNIPEGMAIGLAFALAAQNPEDAALFSGAAALALGIAIQNFPEGTAVALPLIQNGFSKKKAFLIGSMSAVVEPVFGVAAAALAGTVRAGMPWFLSLAAGAMIYVVVQELIPEANAGENEKSGTLGFIVGFLVMMILDVALG
ncbi:MAG: ZIP family metal transporter [Dorea sp.]|uniref:ZIP family metal transporter n=1 Tax=Sporofaciens sp. JLR.KK001 TaxID=3112621 RepID=UPI00216FF57B|nr:ZIP family metal transporter [Dorea sp.]